MSGFIPVHRRVKRILPPPVVVEEVNDPVGLTQPDIKHLEEAVQKAALSTLKEEKESSTGSDFTAPTKSGEIPCCSPVPQENTGVLEFTADKGLGIPTYAGDANTAPTSQLESSMEEKEPPGYYDPSKYTMTVSDVMTLRRAMKDARYALIDSRDPKSLLFFLMGDSSTSPFEGREGKRILVRWFTEWVNFTGVEVPPQQSYILDLKHQKIRFTKAQKVYWEFYSKSLYPQMMEYLNSIDLKKRIASIKASRA